MCLIAFAWKTSPKYKLILAANRDEYFARPTEAARFRGDVLAGRDKLAGGTWLGISRQSRLAAVTNFRSADNQLLKSESRGVLVSDFLSSSRPAKDYVDELRSKKEAFNPFNLLLYDGSDLICYNSQSSRMEVLAPGIYALSNDHLGSNWPKQKRIVQSLRAILENCNAVDFEELLDVMLDSSQAKDDDLPKTGISLERERQLSSIFIRGEDYGTRSTSVLTLDFKNHCRFTESTHSMSGVTETSCNEAFTMMPVSVGKL